ncbi:MAG: ArsR family transcriptional regulator [Spirochaetales bacterium]|nr:ArsR family transcriptional regulator [Spirochaetales bacterium]
MPVQQSFQSVEAMAVFAASPLHEMLVSLQQLSMPWCPPNIHEPVKNQLGSSFREQVEALYKPFNHGVIFTEFACAWEDYHDVSGFLSWVKAMPLRDFVWYLLGSLPEYSKLSSEPHIQEIAKIIEEWGDCHDARWYMDLRWAENIPQFRLDLLDLWTTYWEQVFSQEIPALKQSWEGSIRENGNDLSRLGIEGMYKRLCGDKPIPDPLPHWQPFKRVEFIPSSRMQSCRSVTFYRDGKMVVLYNGNRVEESLKARRELKEGVLEVFKALGDDKRLRMLKYIALNEQVVNGKWLAQRLGLCSSVVSRHLSRLKAAGLIQEHTKDNRNYTYSLVRERITSLGQNLVAYILDTTPEQLPQEFLSVRKQRKS